MLLFGILWPLALFVLVLSKGQKIQEETENLEQEKYFQQTPALTLQHTSDLIGRSKALLLPAILKGTFHLYSNSHSTPVFLIQSPEDFNVNIKKIMKTGKQTNRDARCSASSLIKHESSSPLQDFDFPDC